MLRYKGFIADATLLTIGSFVWKPHHHWHHVAVHCSPFLKHPCDADADADVDVDVDADADADDNADAKQSP